ncbi:hypothetical protein N3K63_00180 [Microbacterium sp. W1N]|uniref:protealysin inhibitor emfourin n=1 Tax=Microbacterium festucae TaxID=2977531 RepID=UPI0021BF4481|nr:protealysin inhibitor emfourin [Microbacterium festucae]MCT9818691.1 hypothetical protein [Microbacterium festucae]
MPHSADETATPDDVRAGDGRGPRAGDGRGPRADAPADAPDDDGTIVVITVVRSGGVAGLVRRWRVSAVADSEPRWITLIDACDWDAAVAAARGADRYQWEIEVTAPPVRHRAQVPDGALLGPWRTLVDAVREADAGAPASERSAAPEQ